MFTDAHARPRFYSGPNHEDFHFVRYYTTPRFIETRASLRELLLRPLANSVAWGLGNIIDAELARALGLPVYTTLYGVAPGVRVVSVLPAGYYVAEAIPANVALVTTGFAGEIVLCNRVPPGAFVAYQTTTTGMVVNEVVVIPPVQPAVTPLAPTAPTVAAESAPPPAPQEPAPTSIPVSSKIGKVVYDSAQKPVGVLILANDGSQEFVPLLAQNDPSSP
ncbi:MAG TPA: hypothetical protein VHH73_09435 [Verrucomicrobiae bacterium]|nr:hypothetical protein [Verrucomicrobiae bacterium]